MPNLTIDNKIYDIDLLPDVAKAQVTSLQFVDAEVQRLNALIAVCLTARNGYISALRPHLAQLQGEDIKLIQH